MSVSCFLVFSWLLQRIILKKESMRKVPNINQYENLTYKRLTLSQCCKHHWSSLQPIHKIYSKLYHFEFLEFQLVFHDIHINFVKNIIRVFFYYQYFLYSFTYNLLIHSFKLELYTLNQFSINKQEVKKFIKMHV